MYSNALSVYLFFFFYILMELILELTVQLKKNLTLLGKMQFHEKHR